MLACPGIFYIRGREVDALKALDKLCGILDMIATFVTSVLMVFLTILIGVNVISRFILNSPIAWQYEVTLVCLSWVVFIGMSITFRNDEHLDGNYGCTGSFVPGLWWLLQYLGGTECSAYAVSDHSSQQSIFLYAFPDWLSVQCYSYY